MTFIRKHKLLFGLSLLFVIIVVIITIFLINISFENENDKYGNRIDGIDNVQISDSKVEEIKNSVLTNTQINKIVYRLDGKLIKFFIEIKENEEELDIENILSIIIEEFDAKEKDFYDFEIFITCEKKKEPYPVIAYKHRNNEVFTITKKEGSNNEE